MEQAKKRGRPKRSEPTVAIGYRLAASEFKALETYAKANNTTVAAESARVVRKYFRELGLIPDKARVRGVWRGSAAG